jgi:hypothetical protein
MAEAEQRSQPPGASGAIVVATPTPDTAHLAEPTGHASSSETFQQFMQEHLHLMDRALYDEEAMLIPLVQDFMERCRLYQTGLERPEQHQRLAGHVQYWESFLKALNA